MTALDTIAFFDDGAGASVAEASWRKAFKVSPGGSGITARATNQFAVSERAAGPNLSVDVATGEAWLRGHWGESTSTKNLPITAAHATLGRIDRVVLRADFTNNTIGVEVVDGTPGASPSAPALTRSATVWEISLAQISVTATDTTIANAQITDERPIRVEHGKLRFPSTTARDLEITSPSEGDECWVSTSRYEYVSAAWVVSGASGDSDQIVIAVQMFS